MKTIICENTELAAKAAGIVRQTLLEKPDAVLALACGRTMEPLWAELAARSAAGELSLSDARVFCVTELCGVPETKSCRFALEKDLLDKTGVKPENRFFPDANAPEATDARIGELGGIDLAVLGIGENCHIGYNEPGAAFDSRTHLQKLTERTKRQLLKRGFTEEDLPGTAVTMGVGTLTDARRILLLASGADKAAAVYQMLYARNTSYIPAAYLQIPPEVTALLDRAAAEKL